MEEIGKMTIELKQFGAALVTRYGAKKVVKTLSPSCGLPTLDFSGVDVTNHSFTDELGKGLLAKFGLNDLSQVGILGANSYVSNCLEAGFATAVEV